MPQFTVQYGDTTRTINGPEGSTQEEAQQIADLHRDMSGETGRQGITNPFTGKPTGIFGGDVGAAIGRKVANFAQGASTIAGGPAQLMGGDPGDLYKEAEKEPATTGDKIARFAGATLPLAPLGAAATLEKTAPQVVRGTAGRFVKIPGKTPMAGAALIPPAVGAVAGSGAPADTQSQRAVNTVLGAVGAKIPGMSPESASALDHLAGTILGGWLGHGLGGHGLGGLGMLFGAGLGNKLSHYAPAASYVRGLLRRFPPSVVARMLADQGYSITQILGNEYNYLMGDQSGGERPSQSQ